ncbi:MAG TPA: class I adenylate-forming enzyme family protein [Nitrobacter sp.]|nr:class I adenylate-forming enzyme family protein [Nitrobacter sp.]
MIQNNTSPTLDELFCRILARQPGQLALIDPPDKLRVTGQPPQRLTFAQADRAISALAAHFAEAGLPANSVIAVQLPNTVELVLTVLAAYRAGLIVALLPQLWRQAELTVAINRTGARAIVAMGRIDGVDHADLAMNAAAEAFSIRHVCGFGSNLPEGMIPLDIAANMETAGARLVVQDSGRAALVTFEASGSGFRAVPRTHVNLIAAGLAVFLESGLPQGGTILSALAPSSFAGLTSSFVMWLLSGGTLAMHHPFDETVMIRQIEAERCDTLVAPAPLALRMAEADLLSSVPSLRHVVGLWRAPEQVTSNTLWPENGIRMTDVYLFGEAGLFGARRADDGSPAPVMPGPYRAPPEVPALSTAGEIILTPKGTLGLRGPMVPVAAYAASEQPPDAFAMLSQPDYVDTGYAARIDRATGAIAITAPPAGVMAVGGYRFLAQDLQEWARRLGQNAMLTALPNRLSGHRLAGRASNNARAREALTELGLNPLMVEAFRDQPIAD